MVGKLLTIAAILGSAVFSAAPAGAQHHAGIGIADAKSPDVNQSRRCFGGDRDGHGDRRVACGFGDSWAYADGQWALYNNRSWEPNSYNDWWHDRPDRAFPRWVQEQRMRGGPCEPDRLWWSGSGWHC